MAKCRTSQGAPARRRTRCFTRPARAAFERADCLGKRFIGHRAPKTKKNRAAIGLEDLRPQAAVRGILPDPLVTVLSIQWLGCDGLGPRAVRNRTMIRAAASAPRPSPYLTIVKASERQVAVPCRRDRTRTREMSQWLEAARVGQIDDRSPEVVTLNGSDVAVFNLDGEYFALEDLCTHLGSDLCSGWVEGERAICPSPLAEFLIRCGQALKAPAYERARSFPVRVRDEIIEVCDERE